jgi:carbonic anhydrase
MAQVKKTTKGQFPKAVVISCVDSRVPVEYVLDQGIGDMFVSRI